MAWKRHRGRRPRGGVLMDFPHPGLMRALGAMVQGERLTLDAADDLRLTAGGDPACGPRADAGHLDELTRRGWVELIPPCSAVATAEGRKWFRIWCRRVCGIDPDTVRVVVATNTEDERDG